MKVFGLIGYPLTHSFSQKYFNEKFKKEDVIDARYENFEIKEIDDLPALLGSYPDLCGLNVTIPYKEEVIKYINELDYSSRKVGAVNVIKILPDKRLVGYNSDYYGFRTSLESWLGGKVPSVKALILGTGGAAKAVKAVLDDCNVPFKTVSRDRKKGDYVYYDLIEEQDIVHNHKLVINTTPLGMYPHINEAPHLPYGQLDESFYLYDLIYNPEETLFLANGRENGANIKNGKEMLILQAEKSWDIWNQ